MRCFWGPDQGPRWGSFIALYGLSETVTLIDRATVAGSSTHIGQATR